MAAYQRYIYAWEGGWSNDPYDPGGATNLGITIAEFADWRGVELTRYTQDALKEELKRLTKDEADKIYRKNYWDKMKCDQLPPGLDLIVYDCAINQGVARATHFLANANDGTVMDRIAAMYEQRKAAYERLPTFFHFGKGWMARLNECRDLAIKFSHK